MKVASMLRKGLLLTALMMMGQPAQAGDDCQIMSGTQQIDYGRFNRDDMRAGKSDVEGVSYSWLAAQTRTFDVTVLCEQPQKIRLFFDGSAAKGKVFRFGEQGGVGIRVKNGRIDDQEMKLAVGGRGAIFTTSADAVTVNPGFGVAAFDGQEHAARRFVVTVELTSYLSPKAFQESDETTLSALISMSYEGVSL